MSPELSTELVADPRRCPRSVPEVSALDTQGQAIDVDPDTKDLLKSLGFDGLPVNVVAPSTAYERPQRRGVPGSRPRRDDA